MKYRFITLALLWLAAFLPAVTIAGSDKPVLQKPDLSKGITRIAFGSCVHQDHEQPIWKAIIADSGSLRRACCKIA